MNRSLKMATLLYVYVLVRHNFIKVLIICKEFCFVRGLQPSVIRLTFVRDLAR